MGNSKELELNDLYRCQEEDESEELGERLSR